MDLTAAPEEPGPLTLRFVLRAVRCPNRSVSQTSNSSFGSPVEGKATTLVEVFAIDAEMGALAPMSKTELLQVMVTFAYWPGASKAFVPCEVANAAVAGRQIAANTREKVLIFVALYLTLEVLKGGPISL
jgi:hypothetical protein